MTNTDYNEIVDAYADKLERFCELVVEYDESWGDEETPTFTHELRTTRVGEIDVPYKRNPVTGDRCRNTKLYRTRQHKLAIHYELRVEFKNALGFLAMSDRELSEFAPDGY